LVFIFIAGKLINLPSTFLHEGGKGGGVIQVTVVYLTAKELIMINVHRKLDDINKPSALLHIYTL